MMCEYFGYDEPTLDEIYERYWESVRQMIEAGLLPKDYAEREMEKIMEQAQVLVDFMDFDKTGGRTVTFTRYVPLTRTEGQS